MKFRSKPVEIEAIQFTGVQSVKTMCTAWKSSFVTVAHYDGSHIFIETLEGRHRASLGDWIIKGLIGEFYPCKDEIFKRKYEAIS